MAETLKNHLGAGLPQAMARMIMAVHPSFNSEDLVREALQGYDALASCPHPHGPRLAAAYPGLGHQAGEGGAPDWSW